MNKPLKRTFIVLIMVQLLLFSSSFSVYGEVPVIASGVSTVMEISVVIYSEHNKPNNTLFSIEVAVEILNRDNEDYTVIDLGDCYPKVQINASFVNKSLKLVQDRICHDTIMYYTYPPGIDYEYETFPFYINQSGLTQLPDGNYTLWRPINTASSLGWVDPAEVLLTNMTVRSGVVNISYPDFEIYTIPEISSEVTIPLTITFLISCAILVVKRRRTKISEKNQ